MSETHESHRERNVTKENWKAKGNLTRTYLRTLGEELFVSWVVGLVLDIIEIGIVHAIKTFYVTNI